MRVSRISMVMVVIMSRDVLFVRLTFAIYALQLEKKTSKSAEIHVGVIALMDRGVHFVKMIILTAANQKIRILTTVAVDAASAPIVVKANHALHALATVLFVLES